MVSSALTHNCASMSSLLKFSDITVLIQINLSIVQLVLLVLYGSSKGQFDSSDQYMLKIIDEEELSKEYLAVFCRYPSAQGINQFQQSSRDRLTVWWFRSPI